MNFFQTSIFKDLAKTLQISFDLASRNQQSIAKNLVYDKYLDVATPSVATSFEELIGKYNVAVTAPAIGDYSSAPDLGQDGLTVLREKVAHIMARKKLDEQDYRNIQVLLNNPSITADQKNRELVKLIFGDAQSVTQSVLDRIDLIFLAALFGEGVCKLDANNNPNGLHCNINFGQPSENVISPKAKWIEDNSTTVNCIQDLLDVIQEASTKVSFAKILMSPAMLNYICKSDGARKFIFGNDKVARGVQLQDLNNYLSSYSLPVIEVIRRNMRLLKEDGTFTNYSPVNENIVFIPEGKLGTVRNSLTMSEMRRDPELNYSKYGFVSVTQSVEKVEGHTCEITTGEAFALPVITQFNGIYTLKTQTERASK